MEKQQSRSQQRTSSRSRSSREAAKADAKSGENETCWDRLMDRMMPSHLETEPFIKDAQKQQRVRQVKNKNDTHSRMAVILLSHICEYTMFLSLLQLDYFCLVLARLDIRSLLHIGLHVYEDWRRHSGVQQGKVVRVLVSWRERCKVFYVSF